MWSRSRSSNAAVRLIACLCLACILVGCGRQAVPATQVVVETPAEETAAEPSRVPLVVFAAGSLIIPFEALEEAFEQAYPHIDVHAEYHGSIQVIRHVTDLHGEIDVVATADAALVPMLMYEVEVPETGQPYADWTIRFASNRIALALTPDSAYAGEVNSDNWTQVVTRPGVRMGISDPRFDALGYRALMIFALAQETYGQPGLFGEMFGQSFTMPVTLFWDEDLATITVPEIVETRPDTGVVLRGASIQLIALLQSGDLDYAFEYESVIRQHGLDMVSLPADLNLGEPGYEDVYARVLVDLDFRRFATIQPQFRGERIGYGLAIPSNAPHPEEAALFIAFLLGPQGRALMDEYAHPMFDPPIVDHYDRVPEILQSLCEPEGTR